MPLAEPASPRPTSHADAANATAAQAPGYRPEIDGLRALSVLAVMGYHAGLPPFSGGYVGVDLFFVISGYLITGIICFQRQTGHFSFAAFYGRRARRILPALLLVSLACLPLAGWLLLPPDLLSFSHSLLAMLALSSNLYFWRQSDYFAPAMELSPLIHTWSLAVEEQFYLVFPALLILLWRTGRRGAFSALAVLAVASLLLAQWASVHRPVAGFYLLPTRGWELLLGALCALRLSETGRRPLPLAMREALSLLGLLLIAGSIVGFDQHTPVPSAVLLLPTVGTALLILFSEGTHTARWLSSRPLVMIGLISYSAYLWHQPLFAFARQLSTTPPPAAWLVLLAGLALGLAYLSWRFVEQPCRSAQRVSGSAFVAACVLGSALLGVFGLAGHAAKGFPERWSEQERALIAFLDYPRQEVYREGRCFLRTEQSAGDFAAECAGQPGHPSTLVWGDSHAAALAHGLGQQSPGVHQYTASGCPPLASQAARLSPRCRAINDYVLEHIERRRPDQVLLHAHWASQRSATLESDLTESIRRIRQVDPAIRVFVVGSVPRWYPSLPSRMIAEGVSVVDGIQLVNEQEPAMKEVDAVLRRVAAREGLGLIAPRAWLCEAQRCRATVMSDGQPTLVAWDDAHLTAGGSRWLAQRVWHAMH